MKTIDKIANIDKEIANLFTRLSQSNSSSEMKTIENEIKSLKLEKDSLETNATGEVKMKNYLETNNSVKDFIDTMKQHRGDNFGPAWEQVLTKNGLTVEDKDNLLPRRLLLAISTKLTEANPVFNLFAVTNAGAILVSRSLTSTDEAFVHIPGTEKPVQNATLRISNVTPRMIGKIQALDEILKRTADSYDEIFNVIVEELVQSIINKIVDLALIEGTATDAGTGTDAQENGFISIMKETDTNKVIHVDGKTKLSEAVEDAVNSLTMMGKKYLVLTLEQRNALMKALRTANPNVAYLNNNQTLAENYGVDDVILYRGTKKISPMVITEKAYAVDMSKLTQVQAFEWKTNENIIQIETVATGRTASFGGIAVIDLGTD